MFKIPVLKIWLFKTFKIPKFASEIPDTSATRLGMLHFCMSEFDADADAAADGQVTLHKMNCLKHCTVFEVIIFSNLTGRPSPNATLPQMPNNTAKHFYGEEANANHPLVNPKTNLDSLKFSNSRLLACTRRDV